MKNPFRSEADAFRFVWLTIGFLLAFMLFNSGGIQVCGWLLGAEMFPLASYAPCILDACSAD